MNTLSQTSPLYKSNSRNDYDKRLNNKHLNDGRLNDCRTAPRFAATGAECFGEATSSEATSSKAVVTTENKSFQSFRYHRKLRRVERTPDGWVHHISKSLSSSEGENRTSVDTVGGFVECSCKDFLMRRRRYMPHVLSPVEHLCKHNIVAILGCARRAEIQLSHERVLELRREWLHRKKRSQRAATVRSQPPGSAGRRDSAGRFGSAEKVR